MLDPHEDAEGIALVPAFSRHETFHPRFGWLKKGFDAAARTPEVFVLDDATTRLGVGKNMVRAIRYWCVAYKVLEERPNEDRPRLRDAVPTQFGKKLLSPGGWDPYLEDPASLWLLHWQLLKSPCSAPSWFAIFNRFRASEFTDETLANQLRLFCDGHPEWGDVAQNSLLKDARCLLRMYANVTSGRDLLEDTIDSPFVDLDLVRMLEGSARHFTLNTGHKQSLPTDIVAYACADFARGQQTSARTMTLGRLAHAPGSPGRAFQLGEAALGAVLDRYVATHAGLRLTQAVGARQLIVDDSLRAEPERLLALYYARAGQKVAA